MGFFDKFKIEIINEEDYEKCIICSKLTEVRKDTDIEFRSFYIEGVGQLCEKCYYDIYIKNNK